MARSQVSNGTSGEAPQGQRRASHTLSVKVVATPSNLNSASKKVTVAFLLADEGSLPSGPRGPRRRQLSHRQVVDRGEDTSVRRPPGERRLLLVTRQRARRRADH